jgi:sortase (surface protein transpeptidase)
MRPRRVLSASAGLALIVATASFANAWRLDHQGRRLVAATFSRDATTAPSADRAVPSPALPVEVAAPVRVEVPAIGISASVVPVGLNPDGSMEVPPTALAGWYRLGPAPGAIGPAVLVGHVDSRAGPAVFYRLTALRRGDAVLVDRADGTQARFVISAITVVGKAEFPTAAVFAPTDNAALRLITCTGSFDPTRHHYTDSLIAWATGEA